MEPSSQPDAWARTVRRHNSLGSITVPPTSHLRPSPSNDHPSGPASGVSGVAAPDALSSNTAFGSRNSLARVSALFQSPVAALLELSTLWRGRHHHSLLLSDQGGPASSLVESASSEARTGSYDAPTRVPLERPHSHIPEGVSIRVTGLPNPITMPQHSLNGDSSRQAGHGAPVNLAPASSIQPEAQGSDAARALVASNAVLASTDAASASFGGCEPSNRVAFQQGGQQQAHSHGHIAIDMTTSSSSERATGVEGSAPVVGRDEALAQQQSTQLQHRYDLSQAARWMEQGLPFLLLLLLVFIREHLSGFLAFLWLTVVLVRFNEFVRTQAALKGDRKVVMLLAAAVTLIGHILMVTWTFVDQKELLLPLLLRPLRESPPFWHAVFIVFVNDNLVRFFGMALKCALLASFSAAKGSRCFRRQAQVLTLMEYALLLYRGLIPAPVWYRYFLNERLGHLFSSLVTGLYLTFKLSSVLDRFLLFLAALRQVVRRDLLFGSRSTPEEVLKAGEMCSICHDKMLSPITLRCHHVFCEDCVSEWLEREQTCPLCRTVVKAQTLKSFGDASTSLTMQIF